MAVVFHSDGRMEYRYSMQDWQVCEALERWAAGVRLTLAKVLGPKSVAAVLEVQPHVPAVSTPTSDKHAADTLWTLANLRDSSDEDWFGTQEHQGLRDQMLASIHAAVDAAMRADGYNVPLVVR